MTSRDRMIAELRAHRSIKGTDRLMDEAADALEAAKARIAELEDMLSRSLAASNALRQLVLIAEGERDHLHTALQRMQGDE